MSVTAVLPQEPAAPEEGIVAPVNRMIIAVLALIGVLISTYMQMYHMGLLGAILCGSGGCEVVQNSPWAEFYGVPVPLLGLLGYGGLLALAMLGIQPRFAADRRIAGLLLAGGVIGFGFSMYLTYLEAFVINAWCRWCIASAILATLLLIAALPEFARLRRRTG